MQRVHQPIAEKGETYPYAAIEYEKASGLTRKDAAKYGQERLERVSLTVNRHANNHYGVNPMTEAESTARFGEPGGLTYAF